MSNTPPLPVVPLWINGMARAGRGTEQAVVNNPASGQAIASVPCATQDDVNEAVTIAQKAFIEWRKTPALRRSRILQKFLHLMQSHTNEFAVLISQEHGKTIADAVGSLTRGIEVIEFACGIPHLQKGEFAENVGSEVDCYSLRQPLGVCVGITPFNFPAMVPLWMFPLAIATGNSFILKPSEKTPSLAVRMGMLLKEAGLPDGVFQVLHGMQSTVQSLLLHPEVKAVSFVGSTPVAKYIYTTGTEQGKRVQALGGAKNHAVVLADADIDFAAEAIIGAGYGSAGERCMAISVVIAVGDAAPPLVKALQSRAAKLKVGCGQAVGVEMGPVISRPHQKRILQYIEEGLSAGAQLVLDGRNCTVPGFEQGFFVGATLFDHVSPNMSIYREEIFGPVLCVVRVPTLDDAIRLINTCPYANGTALFTQSGALARHFENTIEVGMVGINVPIPVPMAFFSFGGWKSSLFGDHAVHGMEGIRFYTQTKTITRRWGNPNSGAGSFTLPTMG